MRSRRSVALGAALLFVLEVRGKVMTIVEQVRSILKLGLEYSAYKRDTITLAWEDRREGHGR